MKHSGLNDKLFDMIAIIISGLLLIITLYPLIYVLSASFSDPVIVTKGELWLLPKGLTLDGYKAIFDYKPIWVGYRNTLFYSVFGTVISLVFTLPCAYALSRHDMKGRNIIMFLFLFTMFFNGGMIPTYLAMKQFGLLNTVWAVLIPGAVGVSNLIIARTYFANSVPWEIQEAAIVDGCSNTRLFLAIVLPLSMPMVAVLTLYAFVYQWNQFFNALIYLSDSKLYPLQLYLRNILLMDQMNALLEGDSEAMQALLERIQLKESMKYGIEVVSTLPVLIIYPFLQKYFAKGVMMGAIKG